MGIFERFRKKNGVGHFSIPKGVTTVTVGSSKSRDTASRPMETLKAHQEWERLYAQTMAGTIIDSEANSLLANGWSIQTEDDGLRDDVRSALVDIGAEYAVWQASKECYKYGYGVIERAKRKDGSDILVPVSSFNLLPDYDEKGHLISFTQFYGTLANEQIKLELDKCIWFALQPSLVDLGVSQISRAYDSIKRHSDISQASAEIIWRHGYPKWDITLGNPDGTEAPADIPARVEGVTSDLAPGSEITTNPLVNISSLDTQGVPQISAYGEWALLELANDMGVPRSVVGIQEGAEATAKVTMTAYYNRLAAEQRILQRTMQEDILDGFILPRLGYRKGDATIVFRHPDPDHDLKSAQYVQTLAAIDSMDPYALFSKQELMEMLGKHPKEDEAQDMDRQQAVSAIMKAIQGASDGQRQA